MDTMLSDVQTRVLCKLLKSAGLGSLLTFAPAAVKATQISAHLESACVEILKSQLKKPNSLRIKTIKSTPGSNGSPGNIIIDYTASNSKNATIKERALCQVPDRATVSMMTAHRKDYSHLN